MMIVKLKTKKELDKLIVQLTLRLGKKILQQDILEACIKLSIKYIDELETYFSPVPKLSKKRVKEILDMADDFNYNTKGNIDADLYNSVYDSCEFFYPRLRKQGNLYNIYLQQLLSLPQAINPQANQFQYLPYFWTWKPIRIIKPFLSRFCNIA